MSIESLLQQRASIERATPVVDGAGDVTPAWAVVATNVPCRIEQMNVDSKIAAAGLVTHNSAQGFFSPNTELRPRVGQSGGDRILVDGVRYLVVGVTSTPGSRGRVLLARLERLET